MTSWLAAKKRASQPLTGSSSLSAAIAQWIALCC